MKLFSYYKYNIIIVISISIILRLLLIESYADKTLVNEWGILFDNLKNNGVLAFRSFDGVLIPTVYMPPLYIYFIYFIDLIIPEYFDLVKSIIILQIFLSAISIIIFYRINLNFFSNNISFFSTLLFSFFPIYIYSSLQISSISLQIFLNLTFIFYVLKILKNNKKRLYNIMLGLISGLSILLRGEFILIFLLSLIYMKIFSKIEYKKILITFLVTLTIISPYLVRNYVVFEKITITKSFGYNLWKGNNIESNIEGSESNLAFNAGGIRTKINELKKDRMYDFNYDKIFFDNSINFIIDDPVLFFKRYVKKFMAFIFFNYESEYKNYYHPLNIFPLIFLSITFLTGIILSSKKKEIKYNFLIFNLFLTIAIFAAFFILPRYKLVILPIQLLISNFLFERCILYFKKKGV